MTPDLWVRPSDRHLGVRTFVTTGHTLRATGEHFGLSASRVRQIHREVDEYFDRLGAYKEALSAGDVDISPDVLMVSARTRHCLRNEGIETIREIADRGERDLLRSPNFGRKSLAELRAELPKWGLTLDP